MNMSWHVLGKAGPQRETEHITPSIGGTLCGHQQGELWTRCLSTEVYLLTVHNGCPPSSALQGILGIDSSSVLSVRTAFAVHGGQKAWPRITTRTLGVGGGSLCTQ